MSARVDRRRIEIERDARQILVMPSKAHRRIQLGFLRKFRGHSYANAVEKAVVKLWQSGGGNGGTKAG